MPDIWPHASFQVQYNLSQFFFVCLSFGWVDVGDKVNDRASIPLHRPIDGDDVAKCDDFFKHQWDIRIVSIEFQQDDTE